MPPPSQPQRRKRDVGELQNTQLRFFEAQSKFWQDTINSAQSAINMAQNDYHNIFAHSTPPSLAEAVFVKVFITLTVAAVPQFAPAVLLFRALNHEKETFEKIAEALADMGKDGREQLNETREQIDAGKKQIAANEVAVVFFRELYMKLTRLSHYVANTWDAVTSYITLSEEPFLTVTAKAHKIWMAAGLLTGPGNIDAQQLSLLFLYDIMRAYTKQNVSLVNPPGVIRGGFSHLSRDSAMGLMKEGKDIEFEGLDPAQRQAMYDRFKVIRWSDPTRPRIWDWKDLLKHWDFSED
jgi:hypothetical protein